MQSDLELTQFVHKIAQHFRHKLFKAPRVDLEDLVQEGMIGLIEAKRRYDPQKGASLKTFAHARISGAIKDSLRSLDWCGRSDRIRIKHFWATTGRLTYELGRAPTSDEAAAAANLSLREFFQARDMAHHADPISLSTPVANRNHDATLEDTIADDRAADGFEMVVLKEHKKLLRDAFWRLTAKERQAVWLYYLDSNDYTQEEVARFMGVGFSRVSQLCTNARKKLEVELRKHQEFGCRGNKANVFANAERMRLPPESEGSATRTGTGTLLAALQPHVSRQRRLAHD